ncbi:MAG: hypothetical protein B7Z78_11115 [Rhodospirillales bacterium 20-60-12]|jgi:membrane protease subunit (stomatin/prohibitin family)|nr:MAG: hypothetical protein B7Z78_11115 [Rhodospirillales bacterium 20-60-12]HQT67233.1 SPFH domain-containing protein [Acetobacteraceae bacterium]HQU01102.1 SPFH domain-containing protein [Acetobacteraceae bacterium]
MAILRSVISTMLDNGAEALGRQTLAWKHPDSNIVSGSLLTVENNEIAILKSRGAILGAYTMGQYPIVTPDKPILGSVVSAFFSQQQPWQFEVFFVSKAKHIVGAKGRAYSKEMAELSYEVDYYFHIPDQDSALDLITHMPIDKGRIITTEVSEYATPIIEQAINQIVQVTRLEEVNENIHEITALVETHLAEFLKVYGIRLDTVKVLIYPNDPLMKRLISFRAFGMSEAEAVRALMTYEMASRGVISAPNMAIGAPFSIGAMPTLGVPVDLAAPPAPPALPPTGSVPQSGA